MPARDASLELYGLAVYCLSNLALGLYLMWALLPDAWLRALGLEGLPNREWAVAVPAWICMGVIATYVAFVGRNISLAPAVCSFATITDRHAVLYDAERHGRLGIDSAAEARWDAYDVPLDHVQAAYSRLAAEHA